MLLIFFLTIIMHPDFLYIEIAALIEYKITFNLFCAFIKNQYVQFFINKASKDFNLFKMFINLFNFLSVK